MLRLFSGRKPGTWNFGQVFQLYNRDVLKSDKLNSDYVELGEWDKGFSDHYNAQLKDLVGDFEIDRVAAATSARKKLLWLTPFFFIFAVIGWKLLVWEFNESDDPSGFGFLFIILSYGAIFWYINRSILVYQTSIKNKIFPRILAFVGNFSFSAEVPAQVEQYKKSGLIPSFSKENNEDQIIGEYNGVKLELFESHLQKWKNRGKRSRLETVFNGLIIVLNMNKDFIGKTVVKQDKGAVGNWFGKSYRVNRYKKK